MTERQSLTLNLKSNARVRWEVAPELVAYPEALARMEREVAAIQNGAPELVWVLEHPPLFTAGTSAKPDDLLWPDRFPVYETGRGGQFTYHGPGQRIAYVMLNLRQRGGDVRAFVAGLEQWIIDTLAALGVTGERREDRVGVWVKRDNREDKIAALGIRVKRGITMHGISINVNPNLNHYAGIVPCGVQHHGVTSLEALQCASNQPLLDAALKQAFHNVFGETV